MEELESRLPEIAKQLSRKGMTTFKQWQQYIKELPGGYGLTQFRISIQRYRMINNPSMRMEHKAGDKMFIDYTGSKLWIYPHGEQPREVEVFVAILGCSLLTYVEASNSQSKEYLITACENAVKLTYKDIFTELYDLHCPDLASLNAAIRSSLERYNNKLLSRRNYSHSFPNGYQSQCD